MRGSDFVVWIVLCLYSLEWLVTDNRSETRICWIGLNKSFWHNSSDQCRIVLYFAPGLCIVAMALILQLILECLDWLHGRYSPGLIKGDRLTNPSLWITHHVMLAYRSCRFETHGKGFSSLTHCSSLSKLIVTAWKYFGMYIRDYYSYFDPNSNVVFSCDQAALQMVFSVCPSVRPSVRHTFLTMFPSSDHHEIFRIYYQWPT